MGAAESAAAELRNAQNVAKEAFRAMLQVDVDTSTMAAHVVFAGDSFVARHAFQLADISTAVHELIDKLKQIDVALQVDIDRVHGHGGE